MKFWWNANPIIFRSTFLALKSINILCLKPRDIASSDWLIIFFEMLTFIIYHWSLFKSPFFSFSYDSGKLKSTMEKSVVLSSFNCSFVACTRPCNAVSLYRQNEAVPASDAPFLKEYTACLLEMLVKNRAHDTAFSHSCDYLSKAMWSFSP